MPPERSSSFDPDVDSPRRTIPPVHQVVDRVLAEERTAGAPRSVVVDATRLILDRHRSDLATNGEGAGALPLEALVERVAAHLAEHERPALPSVINATGIILHTGLGRAPLAEPAIEALVAAARHYVPLELNLATGGRGARSALVRDLLCRLTGAESAAVVNNNAAALMIVLSTLGRRREVVVSRGELIEIGGSFRLPRIMEAGGAVLREVGTTNRTRIADYEEAIGDSTGALMKVHTSNYRIEGFNESVPIEALAALGRTHDLPVIDDIGSGVLRGGDRLGLPSCEPDASTSIRAGADLVLFSGDKVLGGPQAGIIVGRSAWIEAIERNPMMRAMRVDKLRLAALAATLGLHRDEAEAVRAVPVLAMLAPAVSDLEARGRELADRLGGIAGVAEARLEESTAFLGGGSLPAEAVPSLAIVLRPAALGEEELARRLRAGPSPVVARVKDGAVRFDLRTIFPEQDVALVAAVRGVLA